MKLLLSNEAVTPDAQYHSRDNDEEKYETHAVSTYQYQIDDILTGYLPNIFKFAVDTKRESRYCKYRRKNRNTDQNEVYNQSYYH